MDSTVRTEGADAFRPELEGLRGLAVLLVVMFHAGLASLPGGFVGVDVFFVISGFLITGSLVRERERSGTIGLRDFFARRIRRLLPAICLVIVVSLIAAYVLLAPIDRPVAALDAAAAALSVANVRFALLEGDYFASLGTPSPFLHYWALAVEVQFYVVWPAVILVAFLARRPRLGLALAIGAVAIASLAVGVGLTDYAANWAYYSLPSRIWQFALGGMLALGLGSVGRVPRPLLALAGWCGVVALIGSALLLDPSVPYPGLAALIPTLAAVAILAAGLVAGGPGPLLATAPLRFFGRISYSLYLWHWPIFVLAIAALESQPTPGILVGLIALSVLMAWATWRFVEVPFRTAARIRTWRPGRTVASAAAAVLAIAVACTGLALATGSGASPHLDDAPAEVVENEDVPTAEPTAGPSPSDLPSPSATAIQRASPSPEPSSTAAPTASPAPPPPTAKPKLYVRLPRDVRPALADARTDEERLRGDGCLAFERATRPARCVYGDPDGDVTIALVGDSHAAQWFPALSQAAKANHWRILTFVKVACPFIDMRVRNIILKREYTECAAYREATIDRLRDVKPDLTLVSNSRFAIHPVLDRDATLTAQAEALARAIERIPGRVALIVDTPEAGEDVPACLSRHTDDVRKCAISYAVAHSGHLGRIERLATQISGDDRINLTDRICRADPCPVVVDGMIVFRDSRHMTATFARSLGPDLDRAISGILAEQP